MKTFNSIFILFVALSSMDWIILEVDGKEGLGPKESFSVAKATFHDILSVVGQCTDADAVYTRPGERGSCTYDCDCPACAPYCSTSGFCQETTNYGSNTSNGCKLTYPSPTKFYG